MQRSELADPFLLAREVIHFERKTNGELREILLCFADFLHIFAELVEAHAPIVEIIPAHWGMVGEADFRETEFHGAFRVVHRFAGRVAAKRRVHVQIGR